MRLITQPKDGIAPLLRAIKRARKTIDIVIFRFDVEAIEKALTAAIERGVNVRALIAHTNRGGASKLRKLESRLLEAGVTLSRTADDMVRYHGKLLLIDREQAYVMGFNYTRQDIEHSRSFGLETRNPKVVRDILKVVDADHDRVKLSLKSTRVVVSPENARERLTSFIKKAKRELLIYDMGLTDDKMIVLIRQKAESGVKVKILGQVEKKWLDEVPWRVRPFTTMKLHVRCIVRDREAAFVGSQSLRKLELDQRREVGMITKDRRTVNQIAEVFASDWKAN
ncbi:MAG TPA: phospholipase D-like domain-containing protein [Vicinamibacterales bacterium]|jgi:phosphatidylserine/phosphatidylglycerophosphate/cardiolipin synthase-like enzyme